jgi:flavin reductase (DIM6/NTAB) family NADH-FMN oxidoreductase RutF
LVQHYINFLLGVDNLKNEPVTTFKQIMGSYPTGVTILTTTDKDGKPCGLTVNSFASVSIDPLMVLWCLDRRSSSLEAFAKSEVFAVHVLAAEQQELCWAFAGKDPDRFSKASWSFSDNNTPVISDSLGVLECKKVQQIDAGDHIVFIGEVINIDKQDKEPMLFFRRNVGMIPANWPA